MSNLQKRIRNAVSDKPPSCLAGFNVSKLEVRSADGDGMTAAWSLRCICQSARGRLLGYPLSRLVPSSDASNTWMSPLAFLCGECGRITEILDTDQHGYSAEVGKLEGLVGGSKHRGSGHRDEWRCPDCGDVNFQMTAKVIHWSTYELEEFDSSWENLFNEFELITLCASHNHRSLPTSFEKL